QVPSTFVRKTEESIQYNNRARLPVHVINEEVLESFTGSRANVAPPADAPADGAAPPAITPVLKVNNPASAHAAPSDNIPPPAPVVVRSDPRTPAPNPRIANPRDNPNLTPEAAAQGEFYKRFADFSKRYS